jgi:hypothetical protein
MNLVSTLQSDERPETLGKKLVDVTGFEPVIPCLQRTRVLSNDSVRYFSFYCFQWGICFSLEAKLQCNENL